MIKVYDENDKKSIDKQFKVNLWTFLTITILYVLICVGLLIWNRFLVYGSSLSIYFLVTDCVLTLFYLPYAFIFLGIPFKRIRYYRRLVHSVDTGNVTTQEGEFIKYSYNTIIKDGVDFKSFVMTRYYDKKQQDFEFEVLVDKEKQMPEFAEGEKIEVEVLGNVLVGYRRIEDNE